MSKMGYKKGTILGLLIYAAACAGYYPAADLKVYGLFLGLVLIAFALICIVLAVVIPFTYLQQFIRFIPGKSLDARILLVFSFIIICLLLVTTFTERNAALWTVIAVGQFNSLLWSHILTLAIKDPGQHTTQGSLLLVMMTRGGAHVPRAQEWFVNAMGGYHVSFFRPIVCYLYPESSGLKGNISVFIKGIV
jgi:MFS transporter, FHS family, L-fucose permease